MSWFTQTVSLTQIRNADRIWLYAFGVIALLYLLIPTLIVIPMSFSDSQYLEFPPRLTH
nr:MotD [Agrobacterium fabrum]UVY99997.1 MotD [Agrobacterium fabrum]